jgi:hypothetical protein
LSSATKEGTYLTAWLFGMVGYLWLSGYILFQVLPTLHTECYWDMCETIVGYPWYWYLSVLTFIIIGLWLLVVADAFYPREKKERKK